MTNMSRNPKTFGIFHSSKRSMAWWLILESQCGKIYKKKALMRLHSCVVLAFRVGCRSPVVSSRFNGCGISDNAPVIG